MNLVRSVVLVAFAALIASCAVGPRYHKPDAPANAGYAPAPLAQTSASAPIHGGEVQRLIDGRDIPFEWWELFQSPPLDALVARAFRANPTIAAAQAALVQAQELVYAQQGYFFPTINANYNFARTKIAGNFTVDDSPGTQGNGDNLNSTPAGPEKTACTRRPCCTIFTPRSSLWDSYPTSLAPTHGR